MCRSDDLTGEADDGQACSDRSEMKSACFIVKGRSLGLCSRVYCASAACL